MGFSQSFALLPERGETVGKGVLGEDAIAQTGHGRMELPP